MSLKNPEIL